MPAARSARRCGPCSAPASWTGDRAVAREIDRLREGANLDRAEIAPARSPPSPALARRAARPRRVRAARPVAAVPRAVEAPSAGAATPHGHLDDTRARRVRGTRGVRRLARAADGVVVRRGAPLLDAASPTAESVGAARGRGVPILERGGGYVRVEDSSGVRGWALAEDIRGLTASDKL
jgi:hypothetical protein